jgi:hypothetical protein
MRTFWRIMPWIVVAASSSIAVSAPLPPAGTFIYSNACSDPGGDFAGYRVRLILNPNGAEATVEFNDDGSDGHDIARNLTFNPNSGALSFSFLAGDGDQYSFHGTASLEKLIGTVGFRSAGERNTIREQVFTLPVIKTAPKYLPDCDPAHPATEK